MIYLDTHVVVWLYAGQLARFSDEIQALLNENDLIVSPIVQLELQYLHEIERITVDAQTIITDLAARIGLQTCDKRFQAVVGEATAVSWTRDPFDRLIVANASLNSDILISKDQNILNHYPHAKW
ncbi:type II toxin-antitoxin system VapC family toxin [Candidatus Leptofilum sp.]|uniref:type II toxin-antitoxin system VapC family toxin n=1 Tax=Candidatus Leptofilum sp. TaxID=3241576 RepID=UPI003B5A7D30